MADFTFSMPNPYCIRPAGSYCAEIARFLRAHPKAWTQGTSARRENGTRCSPLDAQARRWCMLGLIERFVPPVLRADVADLLERVIQPRFGLMRVHTFNDKAGRTVQDVIDCFMQAERWPLDGMRSSWRELAMPNTEQIVKFEDEFKEHLKKLVPWETIMQQIEKSAATECCGD